MSIALCDAQRSLTSSNPIQPLLTPCYPFRPLQTSSYPFSTLTLKVAVSARHARKEDC